MTVKPVQAVGIQNTFPASGAKFESSAGKFAGQILSSSTAPAGSDTFQLSAKAAGAPAPAQTTAKPAALISAAAAFAGASLTSPQAKASGGPSKSMAEMFFGRSDSGSDLKLSQKVAGGGASDMGGGNAPT